MYREILAFWFEEIEKSQWWQKDAAFDQAITSRFSCYHNKAIRCELFPWRKSGLGRLAEVIILDQFSRNIYRNDPKSFAYDSLALMLSQEAIAGGFDTDLTTEQKNFLYMPFMHSESLLIHTEAEALFAKSGSEQTLAFERKHKMIIEEFGRYPHRNEILGRTSSPEEIEFLKHPGSGF